MKSIIFTHNIPAIIAGTKTQTRRTKGLEIVNQNPDEWRFDCLIDGNACFVLRGGTNQDVVMCKLRYKAGDLVYVKESFCLLSNECWWKSTSPATEKFVVNGVPRINCCAYKADSTPCSEEARIELGYKWASPMFMKQIYSRLTLRILEVKAPERVKSISEADALAEGSWTYDKCPIHKAPELSFFQLWDSINTKRGLGSDRNVWVWPYVFEVV